MTDKIDRDVLREALHDEFCSFVCGHDRPEERANPTHRTDGWWDWKVGCLSDALREAEKEPVNAV